MSTCQLAEEAVDAFPGGDGTQFVELFDDFGMIHFEAFHKTAAVNDHSCKLFIRKGIERRRKNRSQGDGVGGIAQGAAERRHRQYHAGLEEAFPCINVIGNRCRIEGGAKIRLVGVSPRQDTEVGELQGRIVLLFFEDARGDPGALELFGSQFIFRIVGDVDEFDRNRFFLLTVAVGCDGVKGTIAVLEAGHIHGPYKEAVGKFDD